MKRLLIITILGLLAFQVEAQIRWPFGNANEITVTSADTVEIGSDLERGINFIDYDVDTNNLVNATSISSSLKLGDLLLLEATQTSGDADTLSYGTGITGLDDALPAGKTKIILFHYNGTAFQKVSTTQID